MNVWSFILGVVAGGATAAALLILVRRTPAPPAVPTPGVAVAEGSTPPTAPTPPPPAPVPVRRALRPEAAAVEDAIGHAFTDPGLLERALTHRSYVAEHDGAASYERLEFLGDAVLQLAVTRYLYEQHPALAEGEMAKVRAAVVSEPALARFADDFRIAPALRLGRGEEITGGREKESLLSDVVESVIGALYLEAGIEVAHDFVVLHWAGTIEDRVTAPGRGDFKTRLQEVLAKAGKRPEYRLTEAGPPHARTFVARVLVDGDVVGTGDGTSKKRAQQAAARAAIARIS